MRSIIYPHLESLLGGVPVEQGGSQRVPEYKFAIVNCHLGLPGLQPPFNLTIYVSATLPIFIPSTPIVYD